MPDFVVSSAERWKRRVSRGTSDFGLILILLFVAAVVICGVLDITGVMVILPPS